MSETTVKEIVNRAIEDEAFRTLLFSNPQSALESYDLTDEEREMLKNLDEGQLDKFAGGLGDRSTKGWVPGTG